jgi:4-hydroxybenzoyl-CoA thioesterase
LRSCQIVFYPNFQRWMDAASLSFFMQCGVPPWRELVKTRGIVGAPLLEISTRFVTAATYAEELRSRPTSRSGAPRCSCSTTG